MQTNRGACTNTHTHTHTQTHTHTHTHRHTHRHAHTHTLTHTHTHTQTHIHTQAHSHKHSQAHTLKRNQVPGANEVRHRAQMRLSPGQGSIFWPKILILSPPPKIREDYFFPVSRGVFKTKCRARTQIYKNRLKNERNGRKRQNFDVFVP